MNAVQPAYQPEENRREYGAAGRRDVGVRYERAGGAGVQAEGAGARAEGAGARDGAAADGRDDGDIRAMLDFVMKFVATKEDVANLRTEVLEKIGGLRTEVKGEIASLRTEMVEKIGGLDTKIASLRTEVTEKIGGLRAEMLEKIGELDAKIASLRTEMVEKIGEVRSEMRESHRGLERRVDRVEDRLGRIERLLWWVLGIVSSLAVGVLVGAINGWFAMGG